MVQPLDISFCPESWMPQLMTNGNPVWPYLSDIHHWNISGFSMFLLKYGRLKTTKTTKTLNYYNYRGKKKRFDLCIWNFFSYVHIKIFSFISSWPEICSGAILLLYKLSNPSFIRLLIVFFGLCMLLCFDLLGSHLVSRITFQQFIVISILFLFFKVLELAVLFLFFCLRDSSISDMTHQKQKGVTF